MKNKYYYILSIIIFIAGLIAFGNYVYSRYISLNDLLVQFSIPGKANIDIDTPGMYDIYYEDDLAKNGISFDKIDSGKLLTLNVRNEKGTPMPIQRTGEAKKYNYMGRKGESIYEVNLPRKGVYEFSGVYKGIGEREGIILILDKGFSEKRSKTIVTAQAILLFPIIASLVLFLYAYSKSRL